MTQVRARTNPAVDFQHLEQLLRRYCTDRGVSPELVATNKSVMSALVFLVVKRTLKLDLARQLIPKYVEAPFSMSTAMTRYNSACDFKFSFYNHIH